VNSPFTKAAFDEGVQDLLDADRIDKLHTALGRHVGART
jgi:hypothetical protein